MIGSPPGRESKFSMEILQELGFYNGAFTNLFDIPTHNALIKFQETFHAVMLDPWNLSVGTGYKYKTTNKFLNYLVGCDTEPVYLEGIGDFDW